MAGTWVRITHNKTGMAIANGPIGWGITPFEGNYYIQRKFLQTDAFQVNFLPGICFYKFLYVWLNLHLPDGKVLKNLGWMYWLPNPILPFIWYRLGLPANHPELTIEKYQDTKQAKVGNSVRSTRSKGRRLAI